MLSSLSLDPEYHDDNLVYKGYGGSNWNCDSNGDLRSKKDIDALKQKLKEYEDKLNISIPKEEQATKLLQEHKKEVEIIISENKDKILALQEKINNLESQYNLSQNEKDEMQQKLMGQISQLFQENRECNEKYEYVKKRVEELQTKNKELLQELDQIRHRLDTVTNERDQLISDLGTVTNERDQLTGELGTVTNERNQLTDELGTVTSERDQLTGELREKQQELTRNLSEIDQLRNDMMLSDSNVEQLQGRITELETRNNELSEYIIKLRDDEAQFIERDAANQTEIGRLQYIIRDMQSQLKDMDELKARKQECEDEKRRLENQLEIATGKSNESDVKIVQLKHELAEKEGEITNLTQLLSSTTNQGKEFIHQIEQLEQELDNKTNQLSRIRQLLDQANAALEDIRRQSDTIIRRHEATIQQYESDIKRLNDQIDNLNSQIGDLTRQNSENNGRIGQLEQLLARKEEENLRLQQSFSDTKAAIDKVIKIGTEHETTIQQNKQEINRLTATIADLESQIQQMTNDNADKISQLNQKIQRLNIELMEPHIDLGQFNALDDENKDLKERLEQLDKRVNELKAQLDKERNDNETNINRMEADFEQHERKITHKFNDERDEIIGEYEGKLKAMADKYRQDIDDYNQRHVSIDDHASELARINRIKDEMDKESNNKILQLQRDLDDCNRNKGVSNADSELNKEIIERMKRDHAAEIKRITDEADIRIKESENDFQKSFNDVNRINEELKQRVKGLKIDVENVVERLNKAIEDNGNLEHQNKELRELLKKCNDDKLQIQRHIYNLNILINEEYDNIVGQYLRFENKGRWSSILQRIANKIIKISNNFKDIVQNKIIDVAQNIQVTEYQRGGDQNDSKDLESLFEEADELLKKAIEDCEKGLADKDSSIETLSSELQRITGKHKECSEELNQLQQRLQQQGTVYSQSQSQQEPPKYQEPQELKNCRKNIEIVIDVIDRYTHYITIVKKMNDFITENKEAIQNGRKMKTEHIKTFNNKKCQDENSDKDRQSILLSPNIDCRNQLYYMNLNTGVFNIILGNLRNYQNEIQNFINTGKYDDCNELDTNRLNALELQFNGIVSNVNLKEIINDLEVFTDSVRVYIRINKGANYKFDDDEVSIIAKGQNVVVNDDELDFNSFGCDFKGRRSYENFYTVYDSNLNNEQIFKDTSNPIMEPMVNVFDELNKGYNIIIFGYGYSGSGKTHTLFGNNKTGELGIIHHALQNLDESKVDRVFIQDVFDLYGALNSGGSKKNGYEGIRFRKMHYPEEFKANKEQYLFDVYDTKDINKKFIGKEITTSNIGSIFNEINKNRGTHELILPTKNNPQSSRSHLFVTLNIELKDGTSSKLTIVDTAGIEDPFDLFNEMLPKYSSENRFNYHFIPALFSYDLEHLIRFLSVNDIDVKYIKKLNKETNDLRKAIGLYVHVIFLGQIFFNSDADTTRTLPNGTSVEITKEIIDITRKAIKEYTDNFSELSELSRPTGSSLDSKPIFYATYTHKWIDDEKDHAYGKEMFTKISESYHKYYEMDSKTQELYRDYKNTTLIIKQSFFINESLNHLKYYFQNKNKYIDDFNYDSIMKKLDPVGSKPNTLFTDKDYRDKSITLGYEINKSFFNPKDVMAKILSNDQKSNDIIGMISKLHEMNIKEPENEGNPTKYILMGLVNPSPDSNQCDASRKTLEFANDIKSS